MNLDEFDFEAPIEVVIHNPINNQPTDAKIFVLSPHSKAAREIVTNDSREKLAEIDARNGDRKTEFKLMTDSEYYTKAIVSWENIKEGGQDVECTPDEIKRILENKRYFFILDQLDKKSKVGGFSPKPLNDSQSGSGKKHGTKV